MEGANQCPPERIFHIWGLTRTSGGERRVLKWTSPERECVVPPFHQVLCGLSPFHGRNHWCGAWARAYFMLCIAAPEGRGMGRMGVDATSHEPCSHNSWACSWDKTLLSAGGKARSHEACCAYIGTKTIGKRGLSTVLQAEQFMQEGKEWGSGKAS